MNIKHMAVSIISILMAFSLTACASNNAEVYISSVEVSISDLTSGLQTIEEAKEVEDIVLMAEGEEDDTASTESIETESQETKFVDIANAKVGDYVLFGSFEQDNDDKNGQEDLQWLVLDEDDEKILLLSRYVIAKKAYNDTDKAVSWEKCTLRQWLNEEFVSSTFDEKEAEQIITSVLENKGSAAYFSDFKKKAGTSADKKTKDKVFLLSYDEVVQYFEPTKVENLYIYADKDLITTATAASEIENKSLSEKEYEDFYKEEGWPQDCVGVSGSGWFLRSRGINTDDVMSVGYDGAVRGLYLEYGADYESVAFEGGVRPAIWVRK